MKEESVFRQMFPQGAENPPANAQYFIGQSYLAALTRNPALNCPVYNVTFEPGCRNNWHSHTGGQILICTAGAGFYQERGLPARRLSPGDVVEIAPGAVHWHGAAPDSWFAHLAIECNPQTNKSTWLEPVDDAQYAAAAASAGSYPRLSAAARSTAAEFFPDGLPTYLSADPELGEIFGNFAFGEAAVHGRLDARSRAMCLLAAAVAAQSCEVYRTMLAGALHAGVTPAEIREVLFQAIPYAGMAKAADYVVMTRAEFERCGVQLPLERQATTSPEDRFEKGLAMQRAIAGPELIDAMRAAAPEGQKHVQDYLSANCFGDYVTRKGLDVRTRELLTFSVLASLGGCEPQLKGHIAANVRVGNDKETLLAVITSLLPWIGYPRTLNALACLNEMLPENESDIR